MTNPSATHKPTSEPVEMMHRSPVTEAMHYGTQAECTLRACSTKRADDAEGGHRLHMVESPYLAR